MTENTDHKREKILDYYLRGIKMINDRLYNFIDKNMHVFDNETRYKSIVNIKNMSKDYSEDELNKYNTQKLLYLEQIIKYGIGIEKHDKLLELSCKVDFNRFLTILGLQTETNIYNKDKLINMSKINLIIKD
jgi:hypothetical protein